MSNVTCEIPRVPVSQKEISQLRFRTALIKQKKSHISVKGFGNQHGTGEGKLVRQVSHTADKQTSEQIKPDKCTCTLAHALCPLAKPLICSIMDKADVLVSMG